MHTSTSPQYAIIASCDVAAAMMEAPCEQGSLVLFPSWIEHFTNENTTENRVTISFNTSYKKWSWQTLRNVLYYTDNGTNNYDNSTAYGRVLPVQYTIQAHTN